MAEDRPPQPQAPAGFQRPGVPGAGNLLDPAVRADIREKLHTAGADARRQAAGGEAQERPDAATAPEAGEPERAAPAADAAPRQPETARAARFGAGPYPHGDVDLAFLGANVSVEPVRPRRGSRRRFYFLPDAAADRAATSSPAVEAPKGPKPG